MIRSVPFPFPPPSSLLPLSLKELWTDRNTQSLSSLTFLSSFHNHSHRRSFVYSIFSHFTLSHFRPFSSSSSSNPPPPSSSPPSDPSSSHNSPPSDDTNSSSPPPLPPTVESFTSAPLSPSDSSSPPPSLSPLPPVFSPPPPVSSPFSPPKKVSLFAKFFNRSPLPPSTAAPLSQYPPGYPLPNSLSPDISAMSESIALVSSPTTNYFFVPYFPLTPDVSITELKNFLHLLIFPTSPLPNFSPTPTNKHRDPYPYRTNSVSSRISNILLCIPTNYRHHVNLTFTMFQHEYHSLGMAAGQQIFDTIENSQILKIMLTGQEMLNPHFSRFAHIYPYLAARAGDKYMEMINLIPQYVYRRGRNIQMKLSGDNPNLMLHSELRRIFYEFNGFQLSAEEEKKIHKYYMKEASREDKDRYLFTLTEMLNFWSQQMRVMKYEGIFSFDRREQRVKSAKEKEEETNEKILNAETKQKQGQDSAFFIPTSIPTFAEFHEKIQNSTLQSSSSSPSEFNPSPSSPSPLLSPSTLRFTHFSPYMNSLLHYYSLLDDSFRHLSPILHSHYSTHHINVTLRSIKDRLWKQRQNTESMYRDLLTSNYQRLQWNQIVNYNKYNVVIVTPINMMGKTIQKWEETIDKETKDTRKKGRKFVPL